MGNIFHICTWQRYRKEKKKREKALGFGRAEFLTGISGGEEMEASRFLMQLTEPVN